MVVHSSNSRGNQKLDDNRISLNGFVLHVLILGNWSSEWTKLLELRFLILFIGWSFIIISQLIANVPMNFRTNSQFVEIELLHSIIQIYVTSKCAILYMHHSLSLCTTCFAISTSDFKLPNIYCRSIAIPFICAIATFSFPWRKRTKLHIGACKDDTTRSKI